MRFVAPLDKVLQLRRVPLFGDLPSDRLALLVEFAVEELVSAGTVIHVAGEPVGKVCVIVEGDVVSRTSEGVTHHLGADAVVGVFEYFAGGATATLTAATDVVVLSIPTEAIRGILEDHFDVLVHIFKGLGSTLIRAVREAPKLAAAEEMPVLPPHDDHPALGEVERILALRRALPFRHASVDGLATIEQRAKVVSFERGAVLWKVTDDASWLGVILHGVVECEAPLREGAFYFSEEGVNAVGFLDALGDDKRWYEARAASDVTVLTIQKEDLLDTLEDHFDMALACLAAFSEFGLAVVESLRSATARGAAAASARVATARELPASNA